MRKEKFKRGDKVLIAKDLGPSMSHFTSGVEAIVMGSYRDQYGGSDKHNTEIYTVMFMGGSTCSWYYDRQFTMIEHVGEDGIIAIQDAREQREEQETSLEWIVENWKTIRENPPGATMEYLMKLCGITNPWGSKGEGFTYVMNAHFALATLDPLLQTLDASQIKELIKAQAVKSK